MYKQQRDRTIRENLKPIKSVNKPYSGGIIAPPTMPVHSNPEPFGFKLPKPLSDNVNIVGNIIELNSPMAKILHIDINPFEFADRKIRKIAIKAKKLSTLPAWKILVRQLPMNLPTIAPDQ